MRTSKISGRHRLSRFDGSRPLTDVRVCWRATQTGYGGMRPLRRRTIPRQRRRLDPTHRACTDERRIHRQHVLESSTSEIAKPLRALRLREAMRKRRPQARSLPLAGLAAPTAAAGPAREPSNRFRGWGAAYNSVVKRTSSRLGSELLRRRAVRIPTIHGSTSYPRGAHTDDSAWMPKRSPGRGSAREQLVPGRIQASNCGDPIGLRRPQQRAAGER